MSEKKRCAKCRAQVRVYYPFGRNSSKEIIVEHRQDCEYVGTKKFSKKEGEGVKHGAW